MKWYTSFYFTPYLMSFYHSLTTGWSSNILIVMFKVVINQIEDSLSWPLFTPSPKLDNISSHTKWLSFPLTNLVFPPSMPCPMLFSLTEIWSPHSPFFKGYHKSLMVSPIGVAAMYSIHTPCQGFAKWFFYLSLFPIPFIPMRALRLINMKFLS